MKRFYLALAVTFTIAFAVRFAGIYPGYNPYHPDEPTSFVTAIYMNEHFYKPDRFDYPAGMALINAIFYRTLFMPVALTRLFITQPESIAHFLTFDPKTFDLYDRAIFGLRSVNAMYWSRTVSAFFGSLTVVLLYFTAKKLFNSFVGIFAAFFLTVNYRHVLGSQFGLPDIYNSFFTLLCLFASSYLLEKNTAKRYCFAGITAGLVFSIKYQAFVFLLPLFVHLVWTFRTKQLSYLFGKNAWIALVSALAAFIAVNPYYFPNIQNAFFRNSQDIARYQMGVRAIRIYPYFYLIHWGIGILPSIFILLGVFALFLHSKIKFFLIFIFAATFLMFMTYFSNGGIFSRNFITPMPYLMLFAGYGFYVLVKRFMNQGITAKFVVLIIILAVNWQPMRDVYLLDRSHMDRWNIDKLADWFNDKLPVKSIIRTYQLFMFMNFKGQDALKNKQISVKDWDYSEGPNSLREFSAEKTDFAIIMLNSFQSITYWWRQFPRQTWLLNYSEVPYDYILESFFGLTLRELLPHTVAEFYKPWQGREFSFIVFKVPLPPLHLDKRIASFSFTHTSDLWHPLDPFNLSPMTPVWDSMGKNDSGAMKIPPGGGDATTRLVSEPIAIIGGKQYSVTGWIRNLADTAENEDGFLRMDFYADPLPKTLSRLSMDVALSERATSSGEWKYVQAYAVAPKDARFMTVSFQRKNPGYHYTSYVDNIEVYESTPAPETFIELPEYRSNIQWRDVFYPSFL